MFHGRDFPPDVPEGGFGWKVMGHPVSGKKHVLLNRDLFREFAAFLAAAKWDIALLQEVPPRWAHHLAEATGAEARVSLTSRNWLRPVMSPVARFRPHLPGSWEGGSNLVLVRGATPGVDGARPGSEIVDHRRATLSWRPERRVVSMLELNCGLCVANFHAGTGRHAADDVIRAATLAVAKADDRPLLLGGDFNARPKSSEVFERLEAEFGLTGATAPGSIDHILVHGAEVIEPPEAWPAERRDVPDPESKLMIRLSDHAPVVARIEI